ncbi:MAG: metal-dependent hydrolase [Wenzhouxiangella sp.]|jgi:inner membrane protein|nr:metal-dependent hydrolase [Wenzhouxiangella sp.]
MDPVTHGVVGALAALPAARREQLRIAALAGATGGMVADLDALIRSSTDTLLYIEYHRQFTHSFIFAPVGSLLAALVLWPLLQKRVWFGKVYLWCLLGHFIHPLLDACTSYGTQLWWPFSDQRVAWNWISVIDPAYSLPLMVLLIAALWRRSHALGAIGLAWMVLYMGFGAWQNQRAESLVAHWADRNGLSIERLVAKPAFANLLVWRGLVDDGRDLHLVAVRTLPWTVPVLYPGGAVKRFRPDVPDGWNRRDHDLARFDHFSSRWLFHYPELDEGRRMFIGDFRYALDPASQRPLWGILVDPDNPQEPAEYTTSRQMSEADRRRFFQRLRGLPAEAID